MSEKDFEKATATIDGGVTEEQIAAWRAQHRKVIRIEVLDDGELHVGFFHRPTLETMAAVSKIAKTDEVKSAETMFANCWLGGSSHIRKDSILFMEVTTQLGTIFKSCLSRLKNV